MKAPSSTQNLISSSREESTTTTTTTSSQRELKDLVTPAFVINRHAFERNCRSMLDGARNRNLRVRPHVKTHKAVEGAWIQATSGGPTNDDDENSNPSRLVSGFVASTLSEVSMLVDAASVYGGPFRDVLYGVPISEVKLKSLETLRRKLSKEEEEHGGIHVLIDHPTQVTFVESFVENTPDTLPFSVFVKLDTGYHRAGVPCDERGVDLLLKVLDSPHLKLKGVYSHCGHAYDENDASKRQDIATVDLQMITSFLDVLRGRVVESPERLHSLTVSIGSTPSARHHDNTLGLAHDVEIHPGNYTLYDRQQLWIGACTEEADVAGRVLSRVIGHYPDRNTMMLDAGATALTKDSTPQGGVCAIGGHEDELDCYSMSQEVILVRPKNHGTAAKLDFDQFPLGSIVNLLPNHSCLAAACFDKYYIIDDPSSSFSPDQPIVDEWVPAKYWS